MAFTVVQSKLKQGVAAASDTLTFTANTTAGNRLACFVTSFSAVAPVVSGVSDPVNGAWTQIGTAISQASAPSVSRWEMPNAASVSSAQNVTVSWSATGDHGIVILEVSGTPTTASLDPTTYTTNGNATAAAATTVTPTVTTSNAGDFYTAAVGADGANGTWTMPSSPWATVQQSGDNTFQTIAVTARTDGPAAGTIGPTFTWSASANLGAQEFAVLAAAGGGGGLPFFMQSELLTGGMQESGGVRQW